MLRVGLTGGLGSGKSTVAQMFSNLGARVIAADEIGRSLMKPGLPVHAAIVRAFGEAVLRPDGSLDRKTLANLAFQHDRSDDLNRIVHPAVVAAEEEWMCGVFAKEPAAVAIVESALIFEVEKWGTAPGWIERFDSLILVTAPDELKIARFVARAMGSTEDPALRTLFTEDAKARLAAQIPDGEKAPRCNYVIPNRGSLPETRTMVEEIYLELKEKSQRASLTKI